MGNDKEAMTDILTVFVQSTANDLVSMNTLIEQSDFVEMQALCHKMLPMFIQLERDTTFLARMNAMRGKDKTEEDYPNWKEDATQFMAQTDELMDLLAEKYGIGWGWKDAITSIVEEDSLKAEDFLQINPVEML